MFFEKRKVGKLKFIHRELLKKLLEKYVLTASPDQANIVDGK